jgi:hypothetical protein
MSTCSHTRLQRVSGGYTSTAATALGATSRPTPVWQRRLLRLLASNAGRSPLGARRVNLAQKKREKLWQHLGPAARAAPACLPRAPPFSCPCAAGLRSTWRGGGVGQSVQSVHGAQLEAHALPLLAASMTRFTWPRSTPCTHTRWVRQLLAHTHVGLDNSLHTHTLG